jgi:hypothetical protein
MDKVMTGVTDDVPQWSPPPIGGTPARMLHFCPCFKHLNGARRRTAGTPASSCRPRRPWRCRNGAHLHRRKHEPALAVECARLQTAMEPAFDRREHRDPRRSGGSGIRAAMEPPSIGGSTRVRHCSASTSRGRNGARRCLAGASAPSAREGRGRCGCNGARHNWREHLLAPTASLA